MKSFWSWLVVTAFMCLWPIKGLKLVDNGYEDLYIVIHEAVPENETILDRIKEIFTESSKLLYQATHKRAYFKSIKVIIPNTWKEKDYNTTVPAFSSFASHIRITGYNMTTPKTEGSQECGEEGLYMLLHYKHFVLPTNSTSWGSHASVVVHEWGHLRWGLKNEYPTITSLTGNKMIFYQGGGKWKPVGCSRDMKGYASTTCKTGGPDGNCSTSNLTMMIGNSCLFCPNLTQTLNASIMSHQYIPSVVEFCDKDDPSTPEYLRHNNQATNEQNILCNGRSSWEVIREHEDFGSDNNPPRTDENPPPPQFQFVREGEGLVWVFDLNISESMNITNEQFSAVQKVGIDFTIDEGIGLNTTVTVTAKQISNIEIKLTGSNNFLLLEPATQTKVQSLIVSGILEPGQYRAEITSSTASDIEVYVTSKPISLIEEVIRPFVKFSSNAYNFSDKTSLLKMYVYLRKGETPIRNADVTAVVYSPQGERKCELSLLDNGADPDNTPDDGVYTAVVLPICHSGNGSYSSRVVIKSKPETVMTLYTCSGSAIIDFENCTLQDIDTGSFERVVFPDAYSVNNYDPCTASRDITAPGRITDFQVIDIHSDIYATGETRKYKIRLTATGDDANIGQATLYEMRIASDPDVLRRDFMNGDIPDGNVGSIKPTVSGEVECLVIVVNSNDTYTSTTYFAIVAIDDVGNRGQVSNIVPITIGQCSQLKVFGERCGNSTFEGTDVLTTIIILSVITVPLTVFICTIESAWRRKNDLNQKVSTDPPLKVWNDDPNKYELGNKREAVFSRESTCSTCSS